MIAFKEAAVVKEALSGLEAMIAVKKAING
jgi:hypothetical protein